MASRLKRCIDCKQLFRAKMLNRKGRCVRCAEKARIDAANQMQNKKGKYYQRFLEGETRYILSREKGR